MVTLCLDCNLRDFPPACSDYPLGKISNSDRIVVPQINADLLQRLSHGRDSIVVVLWVPLSSRQRDMAVPLVSYPRRSLDEEYLRITMLHPVLLKERMEYVLEAELLARAGRGGRSSTWLRWVLGR